MGGLVLSINQFAFIDIPMIQCPPAIHCHARPWYIHSHMGACLVPWAVQESVQFLFEIQFLIYSRLHPFPSRYVCIHTLWQSLGGPVLCCPQLVFRPSSSYESDQNYGFPTLECSQVMNSLTWVLWVTFNVVFGESSSTSPHHPTPGSVNRGVGWRGGV